MAEKMMEVNPLADKPAYPASLVNVSKLDATCNTDPQHKEIIT
jgi:hypothetical protein